MAGSHKKTPIAGITTATSETHDKRLANRPIRRAMKQALHSFEDANVLPHRRELTNPWTMAKDGKRWFDTRRCPEVLRN